MLFLLLAKHKVRLKANRIQRWKSLFSEGKKDNGYWTSHMVAFGGSYSDNQIINVLNQLFPTIIRG